MARQKRIVTVPEHVRALMRAGWKQTQIAKAVGITQPMVSRLACDNRLDTKYLLGKRLERLVGTPPPGVAEAK